MGRIKIKGMRGGTGNPLMVAFYDGKLYAEVGNEGLKFVSGAWLDEQGQIAACISICIWNTRYLERLKNGRIWDMRSWHL